MQQRVLRCVVRRLGEITLALNHVLHGVKEWNQLLAATIRKRRQAPEVNAKLQTMRSSLHRERVHQVVLALEGFADISLIDIQVGSENWQEEQVCVLIGQPQAGGKWIVPRKGRSAS